MKLRILLLMAAFLALIPISVHAALEDNFTRADSTTLGTASNGFTWSQTSTNLQINTSQFQWYSDGSTDDFAILRFSSGNPTRIDYYNMSWNDSDLGTASQTVSYYIYITNSSTAATNLRIQCLAQHSSTNEFSCFYSGGWNAMNYTIQSGATNNISFRNIEYSGHTYDLFINDVLVAANNPFSVTGDISHHQFRLQGTESAVGSSQNKCITTGATGYTGCAPGGGAPPAPGNNFSFSLTNSYTASSITNFSAIVNGTLYTTTDGSINTTIPTSSNATITVVISSNQSGGYFDKTYSINVNSSFSPSLHQSEVLYRAINRITGNELFSELTSTGGSITNIANAVAIHNVPDNLQGVWLDVASSTGSDTPTISLCANGTTSWNAGCNDISDLSKNTTLNETFYGANGVRSGISTFLLWINSCVGTCPGTFSSINISNLSFLYDNFTSTATNNTATDTAPLLNLSTGTFTTTFSLTGWFSTTTSTITSALQQTTSNYSVYNHQLNITLAVAGSASTTNFTVDIYDLDGYGFHEQLSTTGGAIIANLTHGNYTVYLNDSEHGLENVNVTLPSDETITNLTISTASTNTITFYFMNESEEPTLLVNTTVTVFVTGSIESYNFTTNNGTYTLELIEPDTYIITYSASGYEQRERVYTLSNRTTDILYLYLVTNNATLVLGKIYDSLSNSVENATIRVQRKNLTGTNYFEVDNCVTNVNGICGTYLFLETVTYRFIVVYDDIVRKTTSDTKMWSDTYTITIDLFNNTLMNIDEELAVSGSVVANNATKQFNFTWNDVENTGLTGCLRVQTRRGITLTTINTTCQTAQTYTLTVNANVTGVDEIIGTGYFTTPTSTDQRVLARASIYVNSLAEGLGSYSTFLFGFLSVGVATFATLWSPIAAIMVLVAVLLLNSVLGFIALGAVGNAAVLAIGLTIIFLLRGRA